MVAKDTELKDILIQEITEVLEANQIFEEDPEVPLADELAETVLFVLERELGDFSREWEAATQGDEED